MPDPTPEHVAAVARLICGDPIPAWPWCLHEVRWGGEACSMGIDGGASILTSTDPVVLDAMRHTRAGLVRGARGSGQPLPLRVLAGTRPGGGHHRSEGRQVSELRYCLRGCRRARRHLPDCPDAECRGCEPRQAEHGWLCYGCHRRLVELLTAIPGQLHLLRVMADARGEFELSAPTTARLTSAQPRVTTAADVRPLYARRVGVAYGPSEPIRLACLDVARELDDWVHVLTCRVVEDYQAAGPQEETSEAYAAWLLAQVERVEWREDVADRVFAPGDPRNDREPKSLAHIMSRAHSLAPWREQVAHLHGIPCPECQATTLARFGGSQDVTCLRCDATMGPERYGIWVRILADEQRGVG